MALSHRTNSSLVKPGTSSRRDHVLNLLPPLTIMNDDEISMHDRLFSDDPPLNTHTGCFPRKILRHAEPFTFYSAPTKGELNLMVHKSMRTKEGKPSPRNKGASRERRSRTPWKMQESENIPLSKAAVAEEQVITETTVSAVDMVESAPNPEISDEKKQSGNQKGDSMTSREHQPSYASGFFLT